MKVFLDECVNRRILRHIVGHDVRTARQMGWTSVKNGALLALCASEFEIFVTVDKNLPHQHKLADLDLAVIVLDSRSNRLADLLPLVPPLLAAMPNCLKGSATVLSA